MIFLLMYKMGFEDTVLKIFPKVGDATSWATEKISIWMAGLFNIDPTPFMAKLLTFIFLILGIWLIIGILSKASKLLKWGLIILLVILALSVASSIFL